VASSQNGYPVIFRSSEVAKWFIPVTSGNQKYLPLRPGHTGFILAHFALYFHEEVERLNVQRVWDDWGWAVRSITGPSRIYSNHASGTAQDLNATEHPYGRRGTFSDAQEDAIHSRLREDRMRGSIRWGGDYSGTKDEMHFEIAQGYTTITAVARDLRQSPRGKRIIQANKHYLKYF